MLSVLHDHTSVGSFKANVKIKPRTEEHCVVVVCSKR